MILINKLSILIYVHKQKFLGKNVYFHLIIFINNFHLIPKIVNKSEFLVRFRNHIFKNMLRCIKIICKNIRKC